MTAETYALVGDIGGTNARFALVQEGRVNLLAIKVLPCADYTNLDDAIVDYLAGAGVESVSQVCLAVASPVTDALVSMTNTHWQFEIHAIQRQFGWQKLKVINDFTAMALGVPHVTEDKLVHVCGGPGDPGRPKLVIGPGTGLGVSGLIPVRDVWIPLMTQGGHVDFAPTDETEAAILKIMLARFKRVSVERILSGQGLLNLYQAHAELHGLSAPLDTPDKITAAALKRPNSLAHQVLRHFCTILGRVSGNAALTLGSLGGVYLCGGILPRIVDFLLDGSFQNGFEDKGRMRPLMEFTPVFLVTEPYTGLLGAAEAMGRPEVR